MPSVGSSPGPALPGSSSAGSGLPPTGEAASGGTQTCPHCGALNVADALFCEACGYDFTTGTPPLGSEPPLADVAVEPDATDGGPDMLIEGEAEGGAEAEHARPDVESGAEAGHAGPAGDCEAEAEATGGDAQPEAEATSGDTEPVTDGTDGDAEAEAEATGGEADSDAEGGDGEADPDAEGGDGDAAPGSHDPGHDEALLAPGGQVDPALPPPVRQDPVAHPASEASPGRPSEGPRGRARHTPPSRALSTTWVVEMWVDPDWYAVQQTEEACPSAGVPDIVLLTRSAALVGRPSGSLGVRPEVDAGSDSAVSRRHAQLTSDGRRWWIEDLGSSNGTFVGRVGDPLPTEPITPGQRTEIDRDDRIYVGAWTRLVLREATRAEVRGEG